MSVHVITPDEIVDHPEADGWTVDDSQQVHVFRSGSGRSETVASYAAGTWMSVHRNRYNANEFGVYAKTYKNQDG